MEHHNIHTPKESIPTGYKDMQNRRMDHENRTDKEKRIKKVAPTQSLNVNWIHRTNNHHKKDRGMVPHRKDGRKRWKNVFDSAKSGDKSSHGSNSPPQHYLHTEFRTL